MIQRTFPEYHRSGRCGRWSCAHPLLARLLTYILPPILMGGLSLAGYGIWLVLTG